VNSDNATPNTFIADDYEVGDQFAFEILPEQHYEILARTEPGDEMVSFAVRRSNEGGAEQIDYQMAFPARMPISARRRIRRYNAKCMLCPNTVETEVDTAYYTLNSVVCGSH
jgi:hypothetical protein